MATAVAGIAGGSVSIVGSTVVQQIQQNISVIHQYVQTVVREASRQVSEVSGKSIQGAIQGVGMVSSATGISVVRITTTGFKYFYKVLKDVVAHPRGYAIAFIMYRAINLQVPCSPEPYVSTLDNISALIDSLSIPTPSLPPVTLPLDKYADAVKNAIESMQNKVKGYIQSVMDIDVEKIVVDLGYRVGAYEVCTKPAWYDVPAWFGYVFCNIKVGFINLGLMILRAVLYLVKYIALLLLNIALWGLEFVKWLVYITLTVLDFIGEKILNLAAAVLNTLIAFIVGVANFFINTFIKIPAKAFIKYVLKPMVVLSITIFRWIKDNISRALCWYMRVSPMLMGGVAMVNNFMQGSIGRGIAGFILSALGLSMLNTLLVPECASTDVVADARTPPDPAPIPVVAPADVTLNFYSTVAMRHHSVLRSSATPPSRFVSAVAVGYTHSESAVSKPPLEFRSSVVLNYKE